MSRSAVASYRSTAGFLSLVAILALAPAPARAEVAEKGGAPIAVAPAKTLEATAAAVAKATGSRPAELTLGGRNLLASEGRAFTMNGYVATRLLAGSHERFLKAGLYLFRLERSFGLGGQADVVALVPTTDWAALVRRVGTHDPAGKTSPDQILAWLTALQQDEPFLLDEIGVDYLAGRFKAAPKDPAAVARRCAEIAPEVVKGSDSMLGLLTEEIRANRTLYLIW